MSLGGEEPSPTLPTRDAGSATSHVERRAVVGPAKWRPAATLSSGGCQPVQPVAGALQQQQQQQQLSAVPGIGDALCSAGE
ncbi:uncharacterized protein CTRU02_213579 [Colletotrichum truncatum]|uniref:Uncharacterized protein n=1 Tax=Colletotrichum truncatum TaxID=5467 RepID=A0ACC3YG36_COLTU